MRLICCIGKLGDGDLQRLETDHFYLKWSPTSKTQLASVKSEAKNQIQMQKEYNKLVDKTPSIGKKLKLMGTSLGEDGSSGKREDEENPLRSIIGDGMIRPWNLIKPGHFSISEELHIHSLYHSTLHHNLYCTS